MSLAPLSLSLPPPNAPLIGTAGSPLDQTGSTARLPREGLGLGGIDMPEGMKGTKQVQEDEQATKGEFKLITSFRRLL